MDWSLSELVLTCHRAFIATGVSAFIVPHRILHIIPTLDRSGAEKQLALLAPRLPRDEFDVRVCALTRGGPLAEDLQAQGIPVAVIGKPSKLDPRALWRLKRHIETLRPDVVQTWLFAANSYGRVAARMAGVRRVVAGERCVDRWKSWHELALDRRLARWTTRFVVNGPGVRDFYAAQGLPEEKFTVIPNAVLPPPQPAITRDELCAELGVPATTRLIAAVGRLAPQKRLKDLIWGADILKIIRDDFHLVIIGDGPQRARLEQFREEVHIRDRVHFLGHRADAAGLMRHFDILWHASEYEGLPNAILEAMAAGVPVVASDISGNRDLVVPDATGYLVALGDRPAYAKFADKILSDAELARRLGAAARARAENEFGVEAMVARYAALYRELLNG